ncbi:ArsR/SmtB family transcription factor [Actinoplanes couchii]|uniref:Transcriptional regulator n=1 Tax=Actinoplanes couchii TaxID=403638 RepID=A0ABQ3XTD9_9ACTN|nr:helix-turn-helix domain-containing protein [Actinoplanes couchii]MDR6318716.1 DNA-binding transcriptional ArsR family regulator [Actinoplanes couchii]GID61779.1 transcriptional regulator [Actinoplanes couchii]
MIRIRLDDAAIDRTRITVSPILELVNGIEMVHRHRAHPRAPWPYTDWADRAREVLRTVPELAPLRIYAQLYGEEHGRPTPDLFTPVPSAGRTTVTEQLDDLRRTPHAVIREQFGKHYPEGLPAFLEPYRDDPDRALGRLADALAAFWELTIAPHWPAMRAVLDEEVLLRAQTLAVAGPEALLGDVRGPASWERPVLSLPKRKESGLDARGRRLLLVPVLLLQDTMTCSTDHPEILMITYQARGAAALAGPRTPGPHVRGRLDRLIGPGRSTVLRALDRPATTTGLAAALGLSPSTVSEQLASLLTAGVVDRTRAGRHVLYTRRPEGDTLLATFEDPGSPESMESPAAAA